MSYGQHHVWFVVPAWGHLAGASALAARTLDMNPSLVVTFVTHSMLGPKLQAHFDTFKGLPEKRFRLVAEGNVNGAEPREARRIGFEQLCASMIKEVGQCCSTEASWPAPTALILDQFGSNLILPQLQRLVTPSCKALMYWCCSAACLWGFLVPSESGGVTDYDDVVQKIFADEQLRKGRDQKQILEAAKKVLRVKNGSDSFNGTVISVPGVADMYDYEREMNNMPEIPGLNVLLAEMVKLGQNVDGVISVSSEAIEGPTIAACSSLKEIYTVGIQVAPRVWEDNLLVDDEEVRIFLDKQGANSVLYISFGSMSYPVLDPEQVPALVEILEEMQFPFLLCLGGVMARNAIAEQTMKRVNSSGKGWIQNSWVDQHAVLQHPNVGWFLTHGGWNSVSESLVHGVPLILWPLQQTDQAINCASLSTRENPLGFELLQIRHGEARARTFRSDISVTGDIAAIKDEFREVLSKARGPEGAVLRSNAKKMATELRAERAEKRDDVIMGLARV